MAPEQAPLTGGTDRRRPTAAEADYLRRGLDQPGGKLPLFDETGCRVDSAVVKACLKAGWAEPWFRNPLKPRWEVCRLTPAGRAILEDYNVVRIDFRRRSD